MPEEPKKVEKKLPKGRHLSQIKAARKSKRRHLTHLLIKKNLKQLSKKLERAVAKKDVKEAKEILNQAFSAWDRAAKIKFVHKKTADRKKSRMSIRVASLEK